MSDIKQGLRLLAYPFFVLRTLGDKHSQFYHAFPNIGGRAVIRESFLVDLCKSQRVLHFGFLDAPFTAERCATGALLHRRLAAVAKSLYGVDISEDALETYRRLSGDFSNAIVDIQQPIDADQFSNRFDVIVFGEILEHLRNPGLALANLRAISVANDDCTVCITTPNAFFLGSFVPALRAREIVHPEHYYYFSPATLSRLLSDTGFSRIQLMFYSSRETLGAPGLTKAGLIALCRP